MSRRMQAQTKNTVPTMRKRREQEEEEKLNRDPHVAQKAPKRRFLA
jgi:hypothetical protein